MLGDWGLACFLWFRLSLCVADNQSFVLGSSRLPAPVAGCSGQEMPRTSEGAWNVPSARGTQDSGVIPRPPSAASRHSTSIQESVKQFRLLAAVGSQA